ncbi:MAG: type 4a pilus biogenesis protein PilO, partial [Desulfatiglandales bacterium]
QVSKILPESSEIPSLLRTINRLGEECGLKFLLFVPEVPADKGEYFELPVNIEVRGLFHDVGKFLGLISSMERLFVAHSLSISPQYEPQRVQVTAKFKASTFWLKEVAPAEKK